MLLFERMFMRNVVFWSVMISGFCYNGEVSCGVELFMRMFEKDLVCLCVFVFGLIKNEKLEEVVNVLI